MKTAWILAAVLAVFALWTACASLVPSTWPPPNTMNTRQSEPNDDWKYADPDCGKEPGLQYCEYSAEYAPKWDEHHDGMTCSQQATKEVGLQGNRTYEDYVPKHQSAVKRCMEAHGHDTSRYGY